VTVSGPTFGLSIERLPAVAPSVRRTAAPSAVWPLQVSARDFGLGVAARDGGATRGGQEGA